RRFMQTIDVLRAQQEPLRQGSFEFRQRDVRRVRLRPGSSPATIRVVLPDQLRIALPRLDVRQLVLAVPAPACTLEDRNAALRADSGSGQDEYPIIRPHSNVSPPNFDWPIIVIP